MQAGAHFLLRQAALGEELLHQRVVGLGDVFNELVVKLLRPLQQVAGRGGFGELAALVRRIRDDLVAGDVQHLVEARAGVDGNGQREDAVAEVLAELGQRLVEVGLFLVERIEDDDLGNAVLGRAFPDRVRADADAVVGVHRHHGQVADAQRAQRFADEVGVARAVQDIELLAQPVEVHERGGDGDLPVLLALMIIRDGGARRDAAHAVDHAGARQHGLTEHCFST